MSKEDGTAISDDQNYNIDINKMYNEFISQIDKIRSHSDLLNIDDAFDLNHVSTKVTSQNTAQESRCHAFYRLLGFPVVSKDSGFYNPGFYKKDNDNATAANTATNLSKKKGIAKGIDAELLKLMRQRETYYSLFKSIFSKKDTKAGVLALSSISKRSFISSLPDIADPYSADKLFYSIPDPTDIDSGLTNFSEYIDESGNKMSNDKQLMALIRKRQHIIKPFIVDPAIDQIVQPVDNRLCVPFVNDKSETLISHDVFALRPYIEFVCRERFDGRNKLNNLSPAQEATINYIRQTAGFNDLQWIQEVYDGVGKINETSQFIKILNILRSMMDQLKEAQDKIGNCQSKTLWVPIPSESGPELGSTTRPLIPNDPNNTEQDKNLINLYYKQQANQITAGSLKKTDTDLGNYSFNQNEINPVHSEAIGDNVSDQLDFLSKQRDAVCQLANDSLQTIEVIMGEFSGLGLCDIVVIMGAFWLIDKADLIGLLDKDAYDRMKVIPELKEDPSISIRSDINASLTNFEKKVHELYELADKLTFYTLDSNQQLQSSG